jgi:DNA-binding beta-propeller fold protein YncE
VRRFSAALTVTASIACFPMSAAGNDTNAPLVLERTIALDDVSGRIDHMAIDAAGKRLFVAELGNGTVDVVDLQTAKAVGRIGGLREPQGVAYIPDRNLVAVASAGDGTVRFYRAGDLEPIETIALGDDADNIRIDPASGRVIVGYGKGGLAIVDPKTFSVVREVRLAGHPESFQVESGAGRAFVNVPDARQIAVVDLEAGSQTGAWKTPWLWFNFPMALGETGDPLATVFRLPATLAVLNRVTGAIGERISTCGDADDVFFDGKRSRFYVVCGEGAVDVLAYSPDRLDQVARLATSRGARTGLFVPLLDRLYVSAPAGGRGHAAEILVLRPLP